MTKIHDIFKMCDVLNEIKYMETILAKILVALCYFYEIYFMDLIPYILNLKKSKNIS
jgi:hypothetical protein